MYFGELLGGQRVGINPGPVRGAVHVVQDCSVEVGAGEVKLVVDVVVYEFGEGGL